MSQAWGGEPQSLSSQSSKENGGNPRGRPRHRNAAARPPRSGSSSESESPQPSVSGKPQIERPAPFPSGNFPRGEMFSPPPYHFEAQPKSYRAAQWHTVHTVVHSGMAYHESASSLPILKGQQAQHVFIPLKSPEPGLYMASQSDYGLELIPVAKTISKAPWNQASALKSPKLEQANTSQNHRSVCKSPDRKRARSSQSQHLVVKTSKTKRETKTYKDGSPAVSRSRASTSKGAQPQISETPSQGCSSGLKLTHHCPNQHVESNEKNKGKRAKNPNKSKPDSFTSNTYAQGKTRDKVKSVKKEELLLEDNQSSSDSEEERRSSLESALPVAIPANRYFEKLRPSRISSFSDLTLRMMKSLEIEVQRPPEITDTIFEDINEATPVHMAMLPSLLRLVKKSLEEPSALAPTSRRVEKLYQIQDEEVGFLPKHLKPNNSIIVEALLSRSKTRNYTVPVTKEDRKLDLIGRRVYSASALGVKVANYQAAMSAYHLFLWKKMQPLLLSLPEDKRAQALAIQQEARSLATYQLYSARHSTDCAAKSLSAAVALRRHAWLKSTAIDDYFKAEIEDLPFDGEGVFNGKTDEALKKAREIREVAHELCYS